MTPLERRETIIRLLDHWPEFFDVAGGTATVLAGDSGGGLALLSSMATHPSVIELTRCLRWLREHGKTHFRVVLAYFDAPWRIVEITVKVRNAHGKLIDKPKRERARVLDRDLQAFPRCGCGCGMPRPVCLAVDVLAATWDAVVPLELPRPLLAKLRPSADVADGWTEAA